MLPYGSKGDAAVTGSWGSRSRQPFTPPTGRCVCVCVCGGGRGGGGGFTLKVLERWW